VSDLGFTRDWFYKHFSQHPMICGLPPAATQRRMAVRRRWLSNPGANA